MKNLVFLLLFFISTTVFSQYTIDKEVGGFNEIKVFDLIEVKMIPSDKNRILIKGKRVEDINWVNKKGVLKLRMKLNKKFKGDDTFIEVYYTDVYVIDGNEGARISCEEIKNKNKLELRVQEGAKITINMEELSYVDIRAVTGGIVETSGTAENQTIVLNTGGVYRGVNLKTQTSEVKISAGGNAEIFASRLVDVNVKAGGLVTVHGNPETVNKKTFAGGKVKIIN